MKKITFRIKKKDHCRRADIDLASAIKSQSKFGDSMENRLIELGKDWKSTGAAKAKNGTFDDML